MIRPSHSEHLMWEVFGSQSVALPPLRERNIPYNSNIIVDRLSACVLRTITGNFYILEGKMNLHANTGRMSCACKGFSLTGRAFQHSAYDALI